MKQMGRRLTALSIIPALLLLGGCSGGNEEDGRTVHPDVGPVEYRVEDTGTVAYQDNYTIVPTVGGTVLTCSIAEGDTVTAGQVLYTIDSQGLEDQITQAELGVDSAVIEQDQAQTALDQANVQLSQAQIDLDQAQIGLEQAQNSLAQAQVDLTQAQSSQASAKTALDQANNGLTQAQTALKQAEAACEDLTVRCYTTGTVSSVNVHVGDYVSAGAPVAQVVDNSTLKLVVPFSLEDAAGMTAGSLAVISFPGRTDTLTGTVVRVYEGTVALSGSRTGRNVEISLRNPGTLSSGDTATASVGDAVCMEAGTLSNATEQTIYSGQSGQVLTLSVREGGSVTSGQTVMTLKNDSLTNAVENARLQVENAQLQVDTAQIQVDTAQSQIDNAQLQVNNAQLQVNTAQNQVNTAQLQVNTTGLQVDTAQGQLSAAQVQVRSAQASLDQLTRQRSDYTITAPVDGTILSRSVKEGDLASAGSPMAVVAQPEALCVHATIDEQYIDRVGTGQTAEVTFTTDTGEENTYTGTVRRVEDTGVTSGGVTDYTVEIDLDSVEGLRDGMNVWVSILTSVKEDCLRLPVRAVDGNTVQRVTENGEPETVTVETGVWGSSYVEILSGVTEADAILLP